MIVLDTNEEVSSGETDQLFRALGLYEATVLHYL